MSKKTKSGFISEKETYNIEIKYSPESIEKKLIKFTLKEGNILEISVDELIELIAQNVNSEALSPCFVDTEKINMVMVKRNLKARLDRDFTAGEEISLEYQHPYPLEFAILEEGYNIAKIDTEKGVIELTPEMLLKTKEKTPIESEKFIKSYYKSFNDSSLLGDST